MIFLSKYRRFHIWLAGRYIYETVDNKYRGIKCNPETAIEDAYGSRGYKQQDLIIQIRVNARTKAEWTDRCPAGIQSHGNDKTNSAKKGEIPCQ